MKIKSVDLGLRIESIRRNLGLNKTEFGKLFKATGSLVNKWETGQVIPNEERIKDIADLGNISVNELLYGNIDSFIFETLTDEIERDSRLRELAIDFMNHAMTRVFITGEEKKYIPAKFNDVDKKNFFQTDDLVFMLSGEIGDIVDWIKEFYKEDPVPYDAEKIIRYGCMYFEQKISRRQTLDLVEKYVHIKSFLKQNSYSNIFEDKSLENILNYYIEQEDGLEDDYKTDLETIKRVAIEEYYESQLSSLTDTYLKKSGEIISEYIKQKDEL